MPFHAKGRGLLRKMDTTSKAAASGRAWCGGAGRGPAGLCALSGLSPPPQRALTDGGPAHGPQALSLAGRPGREPRTCWGEEDQGRGRGCHAVAVALSSGPEPWPTHPSCSPCGGGEGRGGEASSLPVWMCPQACPAPLLPRSQTCPVPAPPRPAPRAQEPWPSRQKDRSGGNRHA